jgi:hypothetical protein
MKKKEPKVEDILQKLVKAHDIFIQKYMEAFQAYQARVNNIVGSVKKDEEH